MPGTSLAYKRVMMNQTLQTIGRSLLGLVAFSAIAMPAKSFAWGHLASLATDLGKANIVYQIIREPEIRYCLEIKSTNFNQRSIETQIEHALQVWLKPIQKAKLVGKVKIRPVACNSTDFILKVTLSGETEYYLKEHAAYQLPKKDQDHYYSFIRINTERDFKDPHDATKTFRWVDFGSFNLGSMTAIDRLVWLEKQRPILQTNELAAYGNVEANALYNSTYRVLVHELGHSFGLCDLYEPQVHINCDKVHIAAEHGSGIMQSGAMLMPTADDQRGLTEIVKRLKAEMQGKVYVSPYAVKPSKTTDANQTKPVTQTSQPTQTSASGSSSDFGNSMR